MSDYAVFISSSDSYSDLWPAFFDLFKQHWPEFEGKIYLNTETLSFTRDDLNLTCTQVGHLGSFGKVFRAGLDAVEEQHVLLIMIDYLFMGKVDDGLLSEYYQVFKNHDMDSLCLTQNPYNVTKPLGVLDINLVIPPSRDMFSYQIAFWKKAVLKEMALSHETPWLSEWYGTARANQMHIRLAYTSQTNVIPYLAEGALHKGKWVKGMIDYLKSINYLIDFTKRGYFVEQKATIGDRVKARLQTFWPRLLSNFDLMKRRFK